MTSIDFLKPNYDDFYKFLVSGGVLLLIAGAIVTTFDIIYTPSDNILKWPSIVSYFAMSVAGAIAFFFGIIKWHKNQRILDKKLENEGMLSDLEVKLKKLTLDKTEKELNEVIAGNKTLEQTEFANSFIKNCAVCDYSNICIVGKEGTLNRLISKNIDNKLRGKENGS